MLNFVTGDIFESKMDYITIPVNCGGVAGAGLAEQFKKRYPNLCKEYVGLCKEKRLKPGTGFLLPNEERNVYLFPTKDFWYNDSKIEFIEAGLNNFVWEMIANGSVKSIAFPALGCGFGLLNWDIVKPIMVKHLDRLKNIMEIEIYESQPDREANDRKFLKKIATAG